MADKDEAWRNQMENTYLRGFSPQANYTAAPDLENRDYGRGDPLRWPRDTLYQLKVGTNFADRLRSLGRYRWRTQILQIIFV
jgi:hypothetical protein